VLDYKAEDDDLLADAKTLFEKSLDHDDQVVETWHSDSRMYHNTHGKGQWEQADLDYLKEQKRLALTYNIVKGKVNTFLGLHGDAKLRPRASAVGDEDRFKADVLNALMDRVFELGEYEQAESDCMKFGAVVGQSAVALFEESDPDNPMHERLTFEAVHPYEQTWDPGATHPQQAGYFFWFRWLTKAEFTAEYPDHADDWDKLRMDAEDQAAQDPWGSQGVHDSTSPRGMREHGNYRGGDVYYDRDEDRVRLVYCEYEVPVQKHFVIGNGKSEPISEKSLDTFRKYQMIDPNFAQLEVKSVWTTAVYALEFIGSTLLERFKDDARPWTGFSNTRFCFYWDWESSHSYGMVRDMADPQREVNKSACQTVEMLNAQGMPGVIAEEDAIDDVEQFESDLKRAGGVAIANKGALTGQQIQPRTPPQISPAVAQRFESSLTLLDRVSGIEPEGMTPAGHAEAAATVQLRHHRSKLQHQDPLRSFERMQKEIARKVLEWVVTRPDDQVEEYLAANNRFAVANGTVVELRRNPETEQHEPTGHYADLSDVKSLKFNVDLEVATENSALRIMELMQFLDAMAAGAPVAPEMIAERLTANRADRERLKTFAEDQARNASQAAEQEAVTLERQVEQGFQIQQAEQAERARHNQADEALTAQKMQLDHVAKIATVLEKADADEKAQIQAVFSEVNRRQTEREKLQAVRKQQQSQP